MSRIVPIEDPADERVADYVGLTDAELRRRIEDPAAGDGSGDDGAGIFIAEGLHVIRRLLRSDYRVRSFLVIPRRLDVLAGDLAGLDAPVYVAAPEVMNAVAGFDVHRGALASASRRPLPDPGRLLAETTRVCVLEGIADHENLGAIFRNAAALRVGALLLAPGCCDPLYRRAVRVSMGHVLDVAYATLEPWPEGLEQIAGAGFRLVALTPGPAAVPVDDLGLRCIDRVALLLGAEDRGLTEEAMAQAHVLARIPMAPGVDSLNVASAAAIAFHSAAPAAVPPARSEGRSPT
jgi:tRNA G18 (ribose-2'-O)-methylase SpoU